MTNQSQTLFLVSPGKVSHDFQLNSSDSKSTRVVSRNKTYLLLDLKDKFLTLYMTHKIIQYPSSTHDLASSPYTPFGSLCFDHTELEFSQTHHVLSCFCALVQGVPTAWNAFTPFSTWLTSSFTRSSGIISSRGLWNPYSPGLCSISTWASLRHGPTMPSPIRW